MKLSLLKSKNDFPLFVMRQLEQTSIDFPKTHLSILHSQSLGGKHLEAGVVVLLCFKDCEYTFQLIKRSETVAQAGDISCPGGMLEQKTDALLCHILQEKEIIRSVDGHGIHEMPGKDKQTVHLIQLFLMNALREAWEEIGLSPLNIDYLGALPTYSLTYFYRTIFPVVCLVKEPYTYQISDEVEKVLEIPVSFFFRSSSYAMLEITTERGEADPRYHVQFPCLVIPDGQDHHDILWGATFNIITNFLKILAPNDFPSHTPSRLVQKALSENYAYGKR